MYSPACSAYMPRKRADERRRAAGEVCAEEDVGAGCGVHKKGWGGR
jgi:hypothetical protein